MRSDVTDRFARLKSRFDGGTRDRFARAREEGFEKFERLGFPDLKMEEWKNTDLSLISTTEFVPAPERELSREVLRPLLPEDWEKSPRAVLINGRFSGRLSSNGDVPAGLTITSLANASGEDVERAEELLPELVPGNPFHALNKAFLRDGVFLRVSDGVLVPAPVYVLHITLPDTEAYATFPRTLVQVGQGSELSVVEIYLGVGGSSYFTNAVTDVAVQPTGKIEHVRLQMESEQAFHVSVTNIRQERESRYSSHHISIGGGLVRNDVNALLNAEGAETSLGGLYVARNHQHVDNRTFIDHAQPHGLSRELYKGVLEGESKGVFLGKISVRQDAQKTDAFQTNKNLILSEKALAHTTPQLEIRANDVRCSHGATIGKLDEEAMFYLRSRGMEILEARTLLVEAFAHEITDRISAAGVRNHLDRILKERFG